MIDNDPFREHDRPIELIKAELAVAKKVFYAQCALEGVDPEEVLTELRAEIAETERQFNEITKWSRDND